MVDNILLEVQDVRNTSRLQMYDGAASLTELDPTLAYRGFRRQYCEWNRWAEQVREMNCLYSNTRSNAPRRSGWLWASGNSQRARSMVSYSHERPGHLNVAHSLRTSSDAGARVP